MTPTLLRLFVLLFVAGSAAVTVNVCPTCAYVSIEQAVSAAAAGDTVVIAGGEYHEANPIVIDLNPLTFSCLAPVQVTYPGVWLTVRDAALLYLKGDMQLVNGGIVIDSGGQLVTSDGPLRLTNAASSYAMDVSGTFTHYTPVTITNDAGTTSGGTWQQLAQAELVAKEVSGVKIEQYGTWNHMKPCTLNVSSSSQSSDIRAVSNAGAWKQSDMMTMHLVNALGVTMQEGSVWNQNAALAITATNSTGVTVGNATQWSIKEQVTLDLVNGVGVKLLNSSSVMEQWRNININAGSSSVGVMNSAGGVWKQSLGTATIRTLTASATGISCGSSSSCCTQIQQSLSTTPSKIDFSSGVGSQDDCPKSPSPSPVASIAPLTLNTSATFGSTAPTVNITGKSESSSSSLDVGVQLSLVGLQLGDTETDIDGLTITRTITNNTITTNPARNITTSTFSYEADVGDSVSFVQAYTYFAQAQEMSFAGVDFTVRAGTVKWFLNLTIPSDSISSSTAARVRSDGFSLRYRLADVVSPGATGQVYKRDNTPRAGMTSFFVTVSSGKAVAQVEVLSVAIIDDQVVPLASVGLFDESSGTNNGTTGSNGTYVLELSFPPFNRSVLYDPSIGLGTLLGRSSEDGGSSSSSDVGLIVGVAVAVPVAVALVVVVIGAAIGVTWWRKRKLHNSGSAVNFAAGDVESSDDL